MEINGVSYVALRKESVDRNSTYVTRLPRCQVSLSARRAWIEISIDDLEPSKTRRSLSARRAWIEIQISVSTVVGVLSLSARRAWIEIKKVLISMYTYGSLSARRAWIEITQGVFNLFSNPGRSPQGERG